jgi:hypothetical protein
MSDLSRSLLEEATDPFLAEFPEDVLDVEDKVYRRRDVESDLVAAWRMKLLLSERSKKKFTVMLCLSFAYFWAEISIGVYAASLALIADAFHVLTDVVALAIGFYAAKVPILFSSLHGKYDVKTST